MGKRIAWGIILALIGILACMAFALFVYAILTNLAGPYL